MILVLFWSTDCLSELICLILSWNHNITLITWYRLSRYDAGPVLEHRLADCKQTWTHDGFRYRAFCFTCSNHSWIHTGTRFQNFDVVFPWWNNMGSNPCSIMTELLVRHSTVSIMGYIARAEHGKHGSGTGPARSVLATWVSFIAKHSEMIKIFRLTQNHYRVY